MHTARAMLCSTAVAAVLAIGLQPAQSEPVAKATTPDARWALPDALPPGVMRHLADAQWNGPRDLVAGVFEKVRERPASRDAVLGYARNLAPAYARDLTTAADLAVLTANDRLVLAPNAANVVNAMQSQGAATGAPAVNVSKAFATAASIEGRAVPPSPPSTFDQTWNLTMIGAQIANARVGNYTGSGVSVAVADTGFDVTNDALVNRLDLSRARNYVNNTASTPYDPTYVNILSNTDIHGSHVAGIIAAQPLVGIDMRGVAYASRIVPIRLLLASREAPDAVYGTTDAFAKSLDYFTSLSNVMVYNASYGPNPEQKTGQTVWNVSHDNEPDAAGHALAAGKIIVAAAGNDRASHPIAGLNPSGLGLLPYIQPRHANTGVYNDAGANLDYSELLKQNGLIIAVMSVGVTKRPAYYSNLCGVTASWCVAAPGGDDKVGPEIYSTVPLNTYDYAGGTSMAAPTVSGALAVLIGAFPTYNARQLANLMFSTSEDLGAAGLDAVYGYGLIRLDRATAPVSAPIAGGTVNVAANDTVYWGPPVTTAGGFTKDGLGTLTIAGVTTAPGTVSVASGALAVDGTLNLLGLGSTLSVANSGVLAGFGTINGNTVIDGRLSPGKMPNIQDQGGVVNFAINSPGALLFNGNVTLTANASTAIAVDGNLDVPGGPGTFSRIYVAGAGNVFTINGRLVPVIRGIAGGTNTYAPGLGSQLRIIEAQDGAIASGKFSSLVQPLTGMMPNTRFDVRYASTSVDLIVTPASFAAGAAGSNYSPNQQAVAALLDSSRPDASAGLNQFFDTLYRLTSSDAYATAYRQLAGPGQVASASTAMLALTGFNSAIADRQSSVQTAAADIQSDLAPSAALAYDRSSTSVEARQAAGAFAGVDRNASAPTSSWSVWGRAFGSWNTVDSQNGILGAKTRSGGLTIGADRLLASDLIGGIAGGFVRSNSSNDDASARFDTFTGAAYASYTPGRFVIDMRTAVGSTSMSTTRTLNLAGGTVSGSTNGLGVGADLEVGYRVPVGAIATKPFAGLSTQVFRRNGYTETRQPFGLTFPDQTFTKVSTTLGIASSILVRGYGWNFMPETKLAWAHDLRDTTLTTQAALLNAPLTISNVDPGKDAALVGATLTAWNKESFRLFTSYNGEYRARARTHQVSLGARVNW